MRTSPIQCTLCAEDGDGGVFEMKLVYFLFYFFFLLNRLYDCVVLLHPSAAIL